jgi:5,10-methylenetetrahydrofolate reductase
MKFTHVYNRALTQEHGTTMTCSLHDKLIGKSQGVYVIGTTPPKVGTEDAVMSDIADKLLQRLDRVAHDGIIVYDIQDESTRIDTPRPFPFAQTRDPREYAKMLHSKSGCSTITYNSVAQSDSAEFAAWLAETTDTYHQNNIVLVGSPSSDGDYKLSLNEAYEVLAKADKDYAVGGVCIAERHLKKGDEHERMIAKQQEGCNFFISQAVYNAQATIDMLTSYARRCKQLNIEPVRIVLTFTPCGSAKTLEFMKWLGISVPEATGYRILDADNPLKESIKICYSNLQMILDSCVQLDLPLGLNIESLTNRKEEIDAAIQLYSLLRARMELALSERAIGL